MVTYEFYLTAYHGGMVSPEDWPAAEREAAAKLRRYKKIYTVAAETPDAENMAVCAMAEALVHFAEAQNGAAVSSASIGSVSESYSGASSVDLSPKRQEKDLYKAASLYVDIYRGVR